MDEISTKINSWWPDMDNFTSQYGIEKIVLHYFQEPGFFLEIGAWDGFRLSQTAYLESIGWKGICVDPFPLNFENRKCLLCSNALTSDGRTEKFLKVSIDKTYGGDVSYFSGFLKYINIHKTLIEGFCDYGVIELETMTVEGLFDIYQPPTFIEFLSVDTEGNELEIFQSIDFGKYSFGVITYEHNGDTVKRAAIDELLVNHGYCIILPEISSEDDTYVNIAMFERLNTEVFQHVNV